MTAIEETPDTPTVFVSGRGGGKTYQVLKWCAQDPERRVVVSAFNAGTRDLLRQANDMELPLTDENFVTAEKARWSNKSIAVDNADLLLTRYLGKRPEFVAMTGSISWVLER